LQSVDSVPPKSILGFNFFNFEHRMLEVCFTPLSLDAGTIGEGIWGNCPGQYVQTSLTAQPPWPHLIIADGLK